MSDRSPVSVVDRPTSELIACESRQLAEIEAGLEEAQRGDFASDAEVAAVLAKYKTRASCERVGTGFS